jgi:hypothetical protein
MSEERDSREIGEIFGWSQAEILIRVSDTSLWEEISGVEVYMMCT